MSETMPWSQQPHDGTTERTSAVREEHVTPSTPEVLSCPVQPGRAAVDELAHPDSVLLRPEEVAGRLRLSRARVYELLSTGELASVTIGRSRRVRLTDLITFIQSRQG